MSWFKVELSAPAELWESLSNRCFELGAEGVEEKGTTAIIAYFPEVRRAIVESELTAYVASLKELGESKSLIPFTVTAVKDENWSDAYKKYFHAQKLTKLFFLKPIWEASTPTPFGMVAIEMEPGQAFGTGLHQSTRLSMRLMEKVTRFFSDAAKENLLDVGTGTGILAMAAHSLRYKNITAVDNDPLAVEAAQENCEHNHCRRVIVSGDDIRTLKAKYSVVVSNILLETHKELADEYARLCRPGGYLVLAGLLVPQVKETLTLLSKKGFRFEEARYLQEWGALLLRRTV